MFLNLFRAVSTLITKDNLFHIEVTTFPIELHVDKSNLFLIKSKVLFSKIKRGINQKYQKLSYIVIYFYELKELHIRSY